MHAYDCTVRPAGQVTHEVPLTNISAKELVMLRFVHGREGVLNIRQSGTFADYDVREDLKSLIFKYGPTRVANVFNVSVDDLVEEMAADERPVITDFRVIEEESKSASLEQIMKEAGPAKPAPASAETGPYLANDAAKAAEAQSAGLE